MENLAATIAETQLIAEPEPAAIRPVEAPPGETPPSPRRRKHRVRRILKWFAVIGALFLGILQLVAVAFIWITPPRTSYMLQEGEPVVYQFVSLDHISRYMVAATIAHEDQQLGSRAGGFDIEDFKARAEAYLANEEDPSGSTIPQQLVKNIYLTPDENIVRKGIEAGLAMQFAYTLSDQRVLELYLNYAQFGPKLFGICAATWYYFNTPPWSMTPEHAARLMGVVPFPDLIQRAPEGGAFVDKDKNPKTWDNLNGAANVWVPRQLDGMGGWKAAVETIGITDTAADHEAERDSKDACSTMPDSVHARLAAEGYRK